MYSVRCSLLILLVASALGLASGDASTHHHHHHGKHHHGKHHHHHGKHHKSEGQHDAQPADAKAPVQDAKHKTESGNHAAVVATKVAEDKVLQNMKALEKKLAKATTEKSGQIMVNGPLPVDFNNLFIQAVASATGAASSTVKVNGAKPTNDGSVMMISFTASPQTVKAVEEGATDPDSKIANGKMHSFLVAKDDAPEPAPKSQATPVEEKGIDVDTAMPYGDLEPFGREDTAQELTEDSVTESNQMVDQLERAEVAEEKRAVFRALTRLRGAAITSFDGVARSQTGNIDEYNKIHQWRKTHPLHHLADEESDVQKWAFPDNADF